MTIHTTLTGSPYITIGTTVSYDFFRNEKGYVGLAGVQLKVEVQHYVGYGVVRNIWADNQEGTLNVRFNVETQSGSFLEVPMAGITGVVVEEEKEGEKS